MDRSGVFIDAGYALARGGLVTCGTKSRVALDCDFSGLVAALSRLVEDHGGLPALRVYWYDGAHNRIPTPEHLRIGNLPYVKVRLGRLGADGKQKGVDALIYRDLMTLAREHAIARAYLVAGDEDLREGVVAAQDMGVQVVLLGVAGGKSPNPSQSPDLVREADEVIILDEAFCAEFFASSTPAKAQEAEITLDQIRATGEEIAREWVENATAEEIHAVAAVQRIPRELDVQLLKDAMRILGTPRVPDPGVRELRAGFRTIVEQALAQDRDGLDT